MKYALVNGVRNEAQPKLKGECAICGGEVISRCGEKRLPHWAHKHIQHCDPWWENETEWHRAWKGHFPIEWQEYLHSSANGEKHIADVKTIQNWVLEFQHSAIAPEERRSRSAFYTKLIWVVDGLRLKRALPQFTMAWNDGAATFGLPTVRRLYTDDCSLLKEWSVFNGPVLFDFGPQNMLCWLLGTFDGWSYVYGYSQHDFVAIHRDNALGQVTFDRLWGDLKDYVAMCEARRRAASHSALGSNRLIRPISRRQRL